MTVWNCILALALLFFFNFKAYILKGNWKYYATILITAWVWGSASNKSDLEKLHVNFKSKQSKCLSERSNVNKCIAMTQLCQPETSKDKCYTI